MPQWVIRRLAPQHDRSRFDCGNAASNDWLRLRAGQFDRKDLARVYVATRPGENVVVGYYAISNHRVCYEALPAEQAKGLPRIDVPVVLLGQLAVQRTVQRRGLGSLLVVDALRRAEYVSQHAGVRAVEVHAADEAARGFYINLGFLPLLDDRQHLFLPMQVIRRLALPPLGSDA
jgi:GNAT superfamily N-acetyltransferase